MRGRMARSSVAEVLPESFEDEALGKGMSQDQLTPLYAAALLKVALELRRPESSQSLDELLDRILDGTPVDRDAFRGYLERNFALVRGAGA
jgi:hypothetical protein